MTLCRSLTCLMGTSHMQHMAEMRVVDKGFRNYLRLSNKKILLGYTTIRSFRPNIGRPLKRGKSANILWKNKDIAPKNVGVSFYGTSRQPLTLSDMWKPFIFTTAFSAGSLALCAIWEYENERREVGYRIKAVNFWNRTRNSWTANKNFQWRDELNKMWNNTSEGKKLFFTICLANVLVYIAWKIPRLEPTMMRYFSSNPTSSAICWPLLLSTFSHYSSIHITLNMSALRTFTNPAVDSLGKEQFLGLYLAAGVISMFTSLFFRVLTKMPHPSIGASGAILGITGYISARYPNAELRVFGLPMCKLTATNAITALIAFDLIGLLLGWKFIDHAAHLGGVCFGIFWYHWGNANIWQRRKPLLHWWHELRNAIK